MEEIDKKNKWIKNTKNSSKVIQKKKKDRMLLRKLCTRENNEYIYIYIYIYIY